MNYYLISFRTTAAAPTTGWVTNAEWNTLPEGTLAFTIRGKIDVEAKPLVTFQCDFTSKRSEAQKFDQIEAAVTLCWLRQNWPYREYEAVSVGELDE